VKLSFTCSLALDFLQKNIAAKTACMMQVKLAAGDNFAYILEAASVLKCFVRLFLITYSLALYFICQTLLVQNLLIKCW
jgi:hypothetical protein